MPHVVCHWCFAAVPGVPGVAVWLSLIDAAGLYSYWHPPSAKEAKHRSAVIPLISVITFYHKPTVNQFLISFYFLLINYFKALCVSIFIFCFQQTFTISCFLEFHPQGSFIFLYFNHSPFKTKT